MAWKKQRGLFHGMEKVFHGVENAREPGMDEVKWAWVLFLAATVALLVRLAMWFLPSPAVQHAERVLDAAGAGTDPEPVETGAAAEPAWPQELYERIEWAPLAPIDWKSPPPAAVEPAAPPPEEFHFRRTRWGMALAEVRAAEDGAPLRESERGLLYVVPTLELPSLLTYSFVQGLLIRARLAFSDPAGRDIPPLSVAQAQRRFLYLREQLRARYGEPVQETTHLPRDVSGLRRAAQKHGELARQYDTEIAEAEARLKKQREILERRFERWPNRTEMVARGLKSHERDLRDLKAWKQEALELAEKSRQGIREHRSADAVRPLVATRSARWPAARGVQDIELLLDLRPTVPRLEIRYQATQELPELRGMDDL
jgi:hypothetical protein